MNDFSSMTPQRLIRMAAITYGISGLLGVLIAKFALQRSIFVYAESTNLSPIKSHLWSLGLGICFALIVVVGTPILSKSSVYFRELESELRPIAVSLSHGHIIVLAMLSAVGEELLFRGALFPWIGLIWSNLLFAVLHQTSGRAKWIWILFAFAVGIVFSLITQHSGSLVGAIVSHALINAINLRRLKYLPQRANMPSLP